MMDLPAYPSARAELAAAPHEQRLAKVTAAALAVSTAEGDALFEHLCRVLAQLLEVDATMIAANVPGQPERMRTLATWVDGKMLRCFEYELAGTPCRYMAGREARFVASGVHDEFAVGTMLHAKGFDSYAARSLVDSEGRQTGLIVAMHRGPLIDREITETLLQIFGVRAGAELERSHAEHAARASEQSYRSIFDAAEDAIFVHDSDTGAILDVSPKASDLYGYEHAELLRLRVADLSLNEPPYTEREAYELIQQARNQPQPLRFEWRARRRDGRLTWHEVTLKRARIGGADRVLAFVRDVTDRKAAADALRLSEARYRAIFEGTADALVLWDENVRVVDINQAFTALYGYTRAELVGKPYPAGLPDDYVREREEIVRRGLCGERVELETHALRKNGERFEIEARLLPIRHGDRTYVLSIIRDITERRRAEQRLRESEEQYRAIFNASADALVLWDAQSKVVDVNDAFVQQYGYTREEAIGRGYAPDLPSEYIAERLQLVRRALAGETCEAVSRAFRKDGSSFAVELRVFPFDQRGVPHVLAIARDITDRQRAEARLRATIDSAIDCVIAMDGDGRILEFNPAAERCFGYRRQDVLGRSLAELVIPLRHRAAHTKGLAHFKLSRTGPVIGQRLETNALRADGSEFPIEITVGVAPSRDGDMFIGYLRDITERKLAELALRDSEEQYRAIFNASADGLYLRDAQFRIVDVNPAYVAMKGFERDELVGTTRVLAAAPGDAAERRATHLRVLAGGTAHYEAQTVRRDGSRFDVDVRAMPVVYRGQPHVLYAVRDITEQRRAESERAALEGQLRQAQKMEAIGQLTGGIAHDFNNILASIMGYVVLASERPSAEADARLLGHLEQALTSCRRARDLIQQMLTFSRVRRGDPQTLALGTIVGEVAQLLRVTLPSSLALEVDSDEAGCTVTIDPVQAQQVVLNLCINARDALCGRGRLAVRVHADDVPEATCASCGRGFSGRFIALTVSDDGPGIPDAVRARMFEPFFSTKAPGKGTGMGLATVHRVVHEHGGHLLVASDAEQGTRFDVLLPPAVAAAEPARAARGGALRRAPHFSGRVLVADDESLVLGFMRELLDNWGLEVDVAQDGAAAQELFSGDPAAFDLLITDQTMPGLTGIELAAAAHALRPDLPVILYSGNPQEIEAQRERLGLCHVLQKPVEPRELRAALAQCLRSSDQA